MASSIRRALANVLRHHLGYGPFKLAWNVKIYGNIKDPNNGQNKVKGWDFEQEYEWALENMREMVSGRCNDWLTLLPVAERSPRRYAKIQPTDQCYYPARLKGWKLVNPYPSKHIEAAFHFEGRSGGYVVLEESEGLDLDDLTNEQCRELVAMIPQWDNAFSRPGDELQYQLNSSHERQFEEQQKEATEAQYWAERDVVTA